MNKLLIVAAVTAFHFSALGNYLVDQDGKRIRKSLADIDVICTTDEGMTRIAGIVQKNRGSKVWVISHEYGYVELDKPVCDVLNESL